MVSNINSMGFAAGEALHLHHRIELLSAFRRAGHETNRPLYIEFEIDAGLWQYCQMCESVSWGSGKTNPVAGWYVSQGGFPKAMDYPGSPTSAVAAVIRIFEGTSAGDVCRATPCSAMCARPSSAPAPPRHEHPSDLEPSRV